MTYDVAVIGTGSIAYAHGRQWRDLDRTTIRACADIDRDAAERYAEQFDVPRESIYDDYVEMVREVRPDVVSLCTPENTHETVAIDVARTGVPAAIHSEKAMADTWGGAVRMAHECERRGIQLTFNHQRRFGEPWQDAKAIVDSGEIGELTRMEFSFVDLFTYGTHQIDTFGLFNDDRPAEWVIGQIDYRTENVHRGTHVENQAFGLWEYDNGVYGLAMTGPGRPAVGGYSRLVGTDGELRFQKNFDDDDPVQYTVEVRRPGTDWERTDYEDISDWERTFGDVIDALEEGRRCPLDARNALKVTEIIFGIYESSRRRGRVDLPLDVYDNPLESMVEEGALRPDPAGE